MRLLFDENLSFRLPRLLADVYPGSSHVREVGLKGADDEPIWRYAAAHGFLIVSKDADFFQRSLVYGPPPKVIWLRVGNGPTSMIAALLRQRQDIVRRFYEDPDGALLPLSASRP